MKELKHIKQVAPSPLLKHKVMAGVEELNNETPASIKWLAAAAIIINLLVIAQYSINNSASDQTEYELFNTETIINY